MIGRGINMKGVSTTTTDFQYTFKNNLNLVLKGSSCTLKINKYILVTILLIKIGNLLYYIILYTYGVLAMSVEAILIEVYQNYIILN